MHHPERDVIFLPKIVEIYEVFLTLQFFLQNH